MYRNIKTYELRYTDVDMYDNLKISTLLSLLEESACKSADELGFGYDNLKNKNLGFIIVNYHIELSRNIKLGESITIHTWPLKPRLTVFLRDSEIYVGEEKVGVATARWFMISTKTFSPVPSSVFFNQSDFYGYNTQRSIEFNFWKIPQCTSDKVIYSKTIKYSDYDHYFHVNNTKYADYLFDVFSVDFFNNKYISVVDIAYIRQCNEGDTIDFIKDEYETYYLVEGRVKGELRVQMKVEFAC